MTASQDETAKGGREKAPYHFGEKLRAVRERKGYTLKVVAQRAGVSESLVSQIERNRVSPAIDTLLALAEVLDINLEFLFEEYRKKRPVEIIRADQRRSVDEDGVRYEEIVHPNSSDGNHTMESYLITVPLKGQTHRGSYGHIGRETGFVLSGRGELHYEQNVYPIQAGDGISFSAGAPHVLVNVGDEPLKAVWTVAPSQRFSDNLEGKQE